ncbi:MULTISPECIES: hypothetical protein [Enterobacteriaceae]|mgnify:FL=1|uniref:hypothetical protein n=1 Tax=Enterobacteriaceae TaxID=543 RepID=UPI0013E04B87|nr:MULTISPECIES: hypothetical protein [Enterobacteriaceae]EEM0330771.1 hypothetical protein [Salmonella enterica]EJK8583418.1 hypothetical protein [Enterobacter hormaechei]EJV4343505.1 hypothetical protein [Enterobacter hormaechei]EKK5419595.1 hypothetical protein [Enterobacter hormaechei]EKS6362159.1 hypothetical protein [Enterobacter hormaechei]
MAEKNEDFMTVLIDGKERAVPYLEEDAGGLILKRPVLDLSKFHEVTALGSELPEYITI